MSVDQPVYCLGIGDRVMVDHAQCEPFKDTSSRLGKILVKYIASESSNGSTFANSFQVFFIVVSVVGDVYTVPSSAVSYNEAVDELIYATELQMIHSDLMPYLGCFSHISTKDKNESS